MMQFLLTLWAIIKGIIFITGLITIGYIGWSIVQLGGVKMWLSFVIANVKMIVYDEDFKDKLADEIVDTYENMK